MKEYIRYAVDRAAELLAIDSPTGYTSEAAAWTKAAFEELGYEAKYTNKGGVIADLGGEKDALAVTAHLDDIGLMVRKVNEDGTLNVCPVGGLYPFHCIGENVRIYTREGAVLTGTVCRTPNSIHVTEDELRGTIPDFRKDVCIVLDHEYQGFIH